MPERDPFSNDANRDADLDALRDAWRSLQAPEATPEAEEVDPVTRASVAWLQDAWAAVDPPPVVLPARLLWSARLRAARRNAPILAAAAALVACALFVWRWSPRGGAPEGTERIAQVPLEDEGTGGVNDATADQEERATGSGDGRAPGGESLGGADGAHRSLAPTVVTAAPEPNAIVLEHGSVRLVLLDADEVTTTIEHEPELNPAARRETPALPASPEEGTR